MPLPQVSDILMLICDNLFSEMPTLASLARTCKSLEGPALDVLWSELIGFYPLAKCLPTHEEFSDGTEETNGLPWLKLSHPLTPADCSRFSHYARKVHQFTKDEESCGSKVHDSVYHVLQIAMLGEKLLPNVQQLTWDCDTDSFIFIPMFLGPSLSKFNLNLSPMSDGELSLVPALCGHYPALKDVTFTFSPLAGASVDCQNMAVELFSSSACTWVNLELLSVPSIARLALFGISKLPRLKELEIVELHTVTDSDTFSSGTPKGGFPVLMKLRIQTCDSVSDFTAILKLMDVSPLIYILVKFNKVETSASWKQVFLAINHYCNHNTLTQLDCFDGNFETITASDNDMVTYGDLKPLLVFHNLMWIDIGTINGFYFSNPAVMKKLATSWKNAIELKLRMLPFSQTRTNK
ncbi:hypothetical protein BDQ17DRAFT_576091 [Cyathus striatus]|nr:hypothetical protein BDQ17DRAFT_576091 [Cyathus striatus]